MRGVLLLAVCLGHAFFLLVLTPRRPSTPFRASQGAKLSILPPSAVGAPGAPAEADAPWSPILLSLPSSFGFSASLGSALPRTAPALDLPEEEIQFLPATAARGDPSPDSEPSPGRLGRNVAAWLARPVTLPAHERLLPVLRPPAPLSIHVSVLHGAAADSLILPDWPEDVRARQTQPWEAILQTWHDEDGAVRELLLEARTEDKDLNLALAQAAYRWELQPGAATNWVRVRLRCFGTPWTASPEGAEAP